MAITVTCSRCQQPLQISDDLMDKAVRCPVCKSEVRVNDERLRATSPSVRRPLGTSDKEPDFWDEQDFAEEAAVKPRPLRTLAAVICCATAVRMLLEAIGIAVDVVRFSRPVAFAELVRMLFVATVGLQCVLVPVFLTWFYRAYANLSRMGLGGLRGTAAWAVGAFFVPILNLFHPYQVMQEVWKGSDPAALERIGWQKRKRSRQVLAWWWLWLGAGISAQISSRANMSQAQDLATFRVQLVLSILSELFVIAAGVFFILVVQGVTRRQEDKFERLLLVGE